MFRNPFSFEGRIRRLEYGLSYLIYFGACVMAGIVIGVLGIKDDSPQKTVILLLVLIPTIYFLFAQGAKRCHDRGNSGWWQFIPFYGFFMLFAAGDNEENEYGVNPKIPDNGFVDPFAVKPIVVDHSKTATPIDDVDEDGIIRNTMHSEEK